jgi:hypothetical protein
VKELPLANVEDMNASATRKEMRQAVRKQAVKSRVVKIQLIQKLGMKEQSKLVLRASNLQQAEAQVVEKPPLEGELVKRGN